MTSTAGWGAAGGAGHISKGERLVELEPEAGAAPDRRQRSPRPAGNGLRDRRRATGRVTTATGRPGRSTKRSSDKNESRSPENATEHRRIAASAAATGAAATKEGRTRGDLGLNLMATIN